MKEMNLTEIGEIAQKFWQTIPEHFSFVELDEFVVMPNHVHGLLRIKKPYKEQVVIVEPPNLGVSTSHQTNTPGTTSGGRNPKWKPGTLVVIINQYKQICTINARKIDKDFGWQERFFDHIISNRGSYSKIKNYIRNNPLTWENDKLFQ